MLSHEKSRRSDTKETWEKPIGFRFENKNFSIKAQPLEGSQLPTARFLIAGKETSVLIMQAGFCPETALFGNLCVNLRDCLCGVPEYASAQPLDFLDLEKIPRFQIRNWRCLHLSFWMDTSWEKVFSKFLFFSAVARTGSPHPSSYKAIKTYL
jgi:hypothetical protein